MNLIVSVSVACCHITNHPKTLWLKTTLIYYFCSSVSQDIGQSVARAFFCSVWCQLGSLTQLVAGLEGPCQKASLTCLALGHDSTWPLHSMGV